MTSNQRVKILSWTIDLDTGALSRGGVTDTLNPKSLEVLKLLINNPGSLVKNEEFIHHVWDGNEYVGKRGLANIIWSLRKQLATESGQNDFIKTVPKKGYMLVGEVVWLNQSASPVPFYSRFYPMLLAGLAIFAVILAFQFWSVPQKPLDWGVQQESVLFADGTILAHPVYRPDANQILFSRSGATTMDAKLWLLDTNESDAQPQQLTFGDGSDLGAEWSADSRKVAFIRVFSGQCQVIVLNLFSNASKEVSKCAPRFINSLSWSPDQRYILFAQDIQIEDADGQNTHRAIVRLDLLNGERKIISRPDENVFSNMSPRYSHSGRQIAFAVREHYLQYSIQIVDSSRQEIKSIPFDAQILGLDWFGEEHLIVSGTRSGVAKLWLISLQDGNARIIPNSNGLTEHPATSADDKRLLFVEFIEKGNIERINLQTSEITQITKPDLWDNMEPTISFDDKSLVFESNRASDHYHLYRKDLVTNTVQSLGLEARWPRYSSSSNRLLFVGKCTAESQFERGLCMLDLNSNMVSTLSESAPGLSNWTLDGNNVVYHPERASEFRATLIDLDTMEQRQVCPTGVEVCLVDSMQNTVYFYDFATLAIYQQIDAGEWHQLVSGIPHEDKRTWTVAGGNIYFLRRGETSDYFETRRLADRQLIASYEMEKGRVSHSEPIAISSDLNHLYFVSYKKTTFIKSMNTPSFTSETN